MFFLSALLTLGMTHWQTYNQDFFPKAWYCLLTGYIIVAAIEYEISKPPRKLQQKHEDVFQMA
jgi:hypothetical protein